MATFTNSLTTIDQAGEALSSLLGSIPGSDTEQALLETAGSAITAVELFLRNRDAIEYDERSSTHVSGMLDGAYFFSVDGANLLGESITINHLEYDDGTLRVSIDGTVKQKNRRSDPTGTVTETILHMANNWGADIKGSWNVSTGANSLTSVKFFDGTEFSGLEYKGSLSINSNGNVVGAVKSLSLNSGDNGATVSNVNWRYEKLPDASGSGDVAFINQFLAWALAGNDVLNGSEGDEFLHGYAGNDVLHGFAGNDDLQGGSGNDILDGGEGDDVMNGGDGNDTYVVDSESDRVEETNGEGDATGGIDLVMSSVDFILDDNLENLTLTGADAISGHGNELNNTILGNDGANELNGFGGSDVLKGGKGDDTYVVELVKSGKTVKLQDTVTEKAKEGNDTLYLFVADDFELGSSATLVLGANLENLTAQETGEHALNFTGNAQGNTIRGNFANNVLSGLAGNDELDGLDGNDTLIGGAGADMMIGGLGDDTYEIDQFDDSVQESEAEGIDTVRVKIATAGKSYILGDNIENAELANTVAFDLTGNELPNLLKGNAKVNALAGAAGNDLLQGMAGNDSLTDGEGSNLFDGGQGNDTLTGGDGNDLFVGNAGNDTLNPGAGNDVILFNKGSGKDTVNAAPDAHYTLSLGGKIAYGDLAFSKTGNDLILKTGGADQITFKGWYDENEPQKSVFNLQVVAQAMAGFNPAGQDPFKEIKDQRIETFDFAGLVGRFDEEWGNNSKLAAGWKLGSALLEFQLGGSGDPGDPDQLGEAMGGDLAYQYGLKGTLAGIGVTAAQSVIGDPGFGQTAQTLSEPSTWTGEAAKLG